MFKVFVNDGTQEIPKDDIMYIVAKGGIFLKKKLGVMESIAPVKDISILNGIETMARMHITKIPASMFAKTIEFFRAVNKDIRGSEAIVIHYYNEETGKHKIEAPFQKVSGASLDYTKPVPPEGWNMIGTTHSHNTMSAFHSGVDDADEKYFDGLHITIGNVDEEHVSVSASIVSNGSRFMVSPEDYIDGIELVVDIDQLEKRPYASHWKWDSVTKTSIKVESTHTYTVRKYDKRYDVHVTDSQKIFNKKWMKKVEYSTPTYGYGYGYGWWGNQAGKTKGWSNSFDSSAWKTWKKENVVTKSEVKKIEPPKEKFTGTVEIVEEADINPCEECAFRDHKVEWILDQLAEEETGTKEFWECMQCQTFFCTDENGNGEAICPECFDDDYVVEATEADLRAQEELYYCERCGSEAKTEYFKDGICPFCGSQAVSEKIEERTLTDEELHFLEVSNEEPERIPIPGGNSLPLQIPKSKSKSFLGKLLSRGK